MHSWYASSATWRPPTKYAFNMHSTYFRYNMLVCIVCIACILQPSTMRTLSPMRTLETRRVLRFWRSIREVFRHDWLVGSVVSTPLVAVALRAFFREQHLRLLATCNPRPRPTPLTMAASIADKPKKKSKSSSSSKDFGTSWASTNPSSSSRSCPTKTYVDRGNCCVVLWCICVCHCVC
jgi:hypothetical protein